MCWAILRAGKQESGTDLRSFNKSLLGWPSIQTRRTWISRRIIKSLRTICLEMLVVGTNWKTRHSMVCQQTCKSSHKCTQACDRLLARLISCITQMNSNNIVMWETRHSIVDWVTRVRTYVRFVQHFTQFRTVQQNQKSFLCRNLCSTSQTSKTKEISWNDRWSGLCSFNPSDVNSSHQEAFFVCVWRQWSCHKDDYQKTKSNKSRVQNPQSCSWSVVRSNQFGPQNPTQICWQQKKLADMLTKESFTRREWNHLLRLFRKMSFSMISCSHFSNFLSDPIGKQSAMSKRGKEATSSEGSPLAKPKPMVPAKTSLVNLVSRTPRGAREKILRRIERYPVNLGNVDEGQGSWTSARRLVRTTQKARNRMFSSEATGKCSKSRFQETKRSRVIFELHSHHETCTGKDSKNRVS